MGGKGGKGLFSIFREERRLARIFGGAKPSLRVALFPRDSDFSYGPPGATSDAPAIPGGEANPMLPGQAQAQGRKSC